MNKEQLVVVMKNGSKLLFIPGKYHVAVEAGHLRVAQFNSERPSAFFAAGEWLYCATEVVAQTTTLELEA